MALLKDNWQPGWAVPVSCWVQKAGGNYRAEEASISIQLNLVIPETLRMFMKKESYGLFGDVITQGLVKAF